MFSKKIKNLIKFTVDMFSFKFFVKKWQKINLKRNIARWMVCYVATTFTHNQSNKNLF